MKDFKDMIQQFYPVSGGDGTSIEEAIVFNEGLSESEYVDMEYSIANDLSILTPDIDGARLKSQSLLFDGDRAFDVLKYVVRPAGMPTGGEESSELEIYFDITANFGKDCQQIPDTEEESPS